MRRQMPLHIPLRKFDRDARKADLLAPGEIRPEWYLNLWPYLYRFYDADRRPLYIGITSCSPLRLDSHRRRSEWWPLAEYLAISVYPTHSAVEDAERAAIRSEKPRFNKQGVQGRANVSIQVRNDPEVAAEQLFREATPEFIAELAALLAQPERFPQPVPPPPARFPREGDTESRQSTVNRHVAPDKICNHFNTYGLLCDEYDLLKARAAGRCEICELPEEETPRGHLVIDHFQGGGAWFVRGLLCDRCNGVMARHDRALFWGPATAPFAKKAAEYHRSAWGRPSAEEFEIAAQWIAERKPWSKRIGGAMPHESPL